MFLKILRFFFKQNNSEASSLISQIEILKNVKFECDIKLNEMKSRVMEADELRRCKNALETDNKNLKVYLVLFKITKRTLNIFYLKLGKTP